MSQELAYSFYLINTSKKLYSIKAVDCILVIIILS